MPSGRSRGLRLILVAAALPALFAISYAYRPVCEDGPVVCVSRLTYGIPCPGCGLTRAFCYMAHGEFGGALRFHALAPLVLLYLVLLWIYYLVDAWRGTPPAWNTHLIAGVAMFIMLGYFAARLAIFFASPDGLRTVWHENGIARLVRLFS